MQAGLSVEYFEKIKDTGLRDGHDCRASRLDSISMYKRSNSIPFSR